LQVTNPREKQRANQEQPKKKRRAGCGLMEKGEISKEIESLSDALWMIREREKMNRQDVELMPKAFPVPEIQHTQIAVSAQPITHSMTCNDNRYNDYIGVNNG
jgi:hypothetical protein